MAGPFFIFSDCCLVGVLGGDLALSTALPPLDSTDHIIIHAVSALGQLDQFDATGPVLVGDSRISIF
jgi:hypothetical protein